MKKTTLAATLGLVLAFSLQPASARALRGAAGPLAGTYEITVKRKIYSHSEKPDALAFDDASKSLSWKGLLNVTDSLPDFESVLGASGQISSPTDQTLPPIDFVLTGIRKGKEVYLTGTAMAAGFLPGVPPDFPEGAVVLTGRINVNKKTEQATSLSLTGMTNQSLTIETLKLTGKRVVLD